MQKLLWYRRGGETSERQWLDILGVLAVREKTLDQPYLSQTAGLAGVANLLERALREALGIRP